MPKGWIQIKDAFPATIPYVEDIRCFVKGPLRAIISKDLGRWHMSISCSDRHPTWEEIKQARYDLLPDDIFMVQILPPKKYFVNVHPHTFHLWELREPELIRISKGY